MPRGLGNESQAPLSGRVQVFSFSFLPTGFDRLLSGSAGRPAFQRQPSLPQIAPDSRQVVGNLWLGRLVHIVMVVNVERRHGLF